MAKSKINSFQVFRGFAALAVVIHHTALSTDSFVSKLPDSVKGLFGMGHLGIDFFFVLSGFIIMYAHMDDAHSPSALKHYALKRLTRIYPAYLPIGIAMIALYIALPDFSASGGRDFSLISSLLLIPSVYPPALSVAWTLIHELMFYVVFLLFFVSRRWLASGLIAWGILIFIVNYLYTPIGWLRYPLSLLNVEFIMGVGAAWLVSYLASVDCVRGGRRSIILGLAIAIVALLLMTQENEAYFRLVFAIGLAVVIVGFAVLNQYYEITWPTLLLIMGNASYSIYLIHNPFLSITQRMAGRMGLTWPFAMALGVVLSLLAGWIYYLVVERSSLRFFQQRLRKQ